MNVKSRWSRLDSKVTIAPSHDLPGYHEISFLVSDGSFAKPHGISVDENSNSHVDAHRWVAIQSNSSVKKKWLKTLGQAIASHFSMVQGRERYILSDFPSGYQIFDHVKNSEHTSYLFGYPTKSKLILKFRTANEFLSHLIWLASPGEKNRCACRNCQSSTFRSDGQKTLISSLDSHPAEIKIKNEFKRKKSENMNTVPPDSHHREGLSTNFRLGELVWCELDPKAAKIKLNSKYWPGICHETRVTLKACEVLDLSTQETILDPREQSQHQRSRDVAPTTWISKKEVRKERYWHIKLLGVSDSAIRTESQILPWLYHPFEESAWRVVSTANLPLPTYLNDLRNPLPNLTSLSNPVVSRLSFQLAVQIAGEIEESWAPAEHLEKIGTCSDKPHSDQKVPRDVLLNDTSLIQLFKSVWLGAEKICTADLVRLKMLLNDIDNITDTSIDCSDQMLFMHINFFWKLPNSQSTVAAGRIFELVRQSGGPNETGKLQQPKCTWLRQCADQVPKSFTVDNSDELPPPPKGFQFWKITPINKIHHLDLRCIAGRYYSPQNRHEALRSLGHHFSANNENNNSTIQFEASKLKKLKSLLGIRCGQENHMRISKMKTSREEILRLALKNSRKMMSSHFRSQSPVKNNNNK